MPNAGSGGGGGGVVFISGGSSGSVMQIAPGQTMVFNVLVGDCLTVTSWAGWRLGQWKSGE